MSVSLHSNTTRLPDTILGAISLAASSGIENISALFTSRPEQLPQRSAALNEDEAAFLEAAEEQYLASQRPMRRSPFFRR